MSDRRDPHWKGRIAWVPAEFVPVTEHGDWCVQTIHVSDQHENEQAGLHGPLCRREPDPVECAICGSYTAQGVEVHEACLARLNTTAWSDRR